MAKIRSLGDVSSISINLESTDLLSADFTIYQQIDNTYKAHFTLKIGNELDGHQILHIKLGEYPSLESALSHCHTLQKSLSHKGVTVRSY